MKVKRAQYSDEDKASALALADRLQRQREQRRSIHLEKLAIEASRCNRSVGLRRAYAFRSVIAGISISLTHATLDSPIRHFTINTKSWTGMRVPAYASIALSTPSS